MKGKGKRDGECGREWWILGKGKEKMREGLAEWGRGKKERNREKKMEKKEEGGWGKERA